MTRKIIINGQTMEKGQTIKVTAVRVPIYANPYYTPSNQETTKTLTSTGIGSLEKGLVVKWGKSCGRLTLRNGEGILFNKKSKWEVWATK